MKKLLLKENGDIVKKGTPIIEIPIFSIGDFFQSNKYSILPCLGLFRPAMSKFTTILKKLLLSDFKSIDSNVLFHQVFFYPYNKTNPKKK